VTESRPVRLLLDLNIHISDFLSRAAGRTGTTSQKVVDAVLSRRLGGRTVQPVVSLKMLDRFHDVLLRLGADPAAAAAAKEAPIDMTRYGPDGLDPYLLLDRSEASLPLADSEDAGVLATAFAARANLLVTDNLADFATMGGTIVKTSIARHSDGRQRQLTCQILTSPSGHRLVIAHPLDVLARAAQGRSIAFDDDG
jgi:PIN domain